MNDYGVTTEFMVPEISDTCMFLTTANDIWDAMQWAYLKARDVAQVYEVKVKTMATKKCYKQL